MYCLICYRIVWIVFVFYKLPKWDMKTSPSNPGRMIVSDSLGFLLAYSWCSEISYPADCCFKTVGVGQETLFCHLLHPQTSVSEIQGLRLQAPKCRSGASIFRGAVGKWHSRGFGWKICKRTIQIASVLVPSPSPTSNLGQGRIKWVRTEKEVVTRRKELLSVRGLVSCGVFFEGCILPVMESTQMEYIL